MRNIKVLLEYDGTNYHGFQRQTDDLPTIQKSLEEALGLLVKYPVTVTGSGRTDAGVHALGQVINFFSECRIPVDRLPLAMNSLLPKDIAAIEAQEVDAGFHAQFSARSKVYRYHIYNSRIPSAFERLYSYHVPQGLDIERMRQAARYMVGEHDFTAFRAAGSCAKTSVRHVYRLDIEHTPPHIYITVEANGFLYNMVRIISGTLLYVGRGKLSPSEVRDIVNSGRREEAGPTVPPQGLFLMEVKY
ncbi:tRNA pseudouridine(38-40) synthase TruA [Phosphitispora sp. TUW77]|uniref:tRNA pseudouridine(38-40) synthase TruA n=1 Tax=Phosphitispora sp. TUW77 TaxID=3152361 RepID=UPI003AB84DBF